METEITRFVDNLDYLERELREVGAELSLLREIQTYAAEKIVNLALRQEGLRRRIATAKAAVRAA